MMYTYCARRPVRQMKEETSLKEIIDSSAQFLIKVQDDQVEMAGEFEVCQPSLPSYFSHSPNFEIESSFRFDIWVANHVPRSDSSIRLFLIWDLPHLFGINPNHLVFFYERGVHRLKLPGLRANSLMPTILANFCNRRNFRFGIYE